MLYFVFFFMWCLHLLECMFSYNYSILTLIHRIQRSETQLQQREGKRTGHRSVMDTESSRLFRERNGKVKFFFCQALEVSPSFWHQNPADKTLTKNHFIKWICTAHSWIETASHNILILRILFPKEQKKKENYNRYTTGVLQYPKCFKTSPYCTRAL